MISAPLEDMSPLLDIKTLKKNVKSLDQLSLQIVEVKLKYNSKLESFRYMGL